MGGMNGRHGKTRFGREMWGVGIFESRCAGGGTFLDVRRRMGKWEGAEGENGVWFSEPRTFCLSMLFQILSAILKKKKNKISLPSSPGFLIPHNTSPGKAVLCPSPTIDRRPRSLKRLQRLPQLFPAVEGRITAVAVPRLMVEFGVAADAEDVQTVRAPTDERGRGGEAALFRVPGVDGRVPLVPVPVLVVVLRVGAQADDVDAVRGPAGGADGGAEAAAQILPVVGRPARAVPVAVGEPAVGPHGEDVEPVLAPRDDGRGAGKGPAEALPADPARAVPEFMQQLAPGARVHGEDVQPVRAPRDGGGFADEIAAEVLQPLVGAGGPFVPGPVFVPDGVVAGGVGAGAEDIQPVGAPGRGREQTGRLQFPAEVFEFGVGRVPAGSVPVFVQEIAVEAGGEDVEAVISPRDCCGGVAVFSAEGFQVDGRGFPLRPVPELVAEVACECRAAEDVVASGSPGDGGDADGTASQRGKGLDCLRLGRGGMVAWSQRFAWSSSSVQVVGRLTPAEEVLSDDSNERCHGIDRIPGLSKNKNKLKM